jgi:hypothetical protein
MIKTTIFKATNSDWIPSFKVSNGGKFVSSLVRISMMLLHDGKTYRICAWGADDFGMEYDSENITDINHTWIHIVAADTVDMSWLTALGFKKV